MLRLPSRGLAHLHNASPRIELLAHRGGSDGLFPENTIAAFSEGVRHKADVLEMDVHLTWDGVVVVNHDPVIMEPDGTVRTVVSLSRADLHRLNPDGVSGISTLQEILSHFPKQRFNIDLKTAEKALAIAVKREIELAGATERTVVASFHPEALEYFRSIAPNVVTSTHPREVKQILFASLLQSKPAATTRILQVPSHFHRFPLVSRRFLRYAHAQGFRVHVWTINETAQALRLLRAGIDGIITDRVAAIRGALLEHGYEEIDH